jgi:hypothetical protein
MEFLAIQKYQKDFSWGENMFFSQMALIGCLHPRHHSQGSDFHPVSASPTPPS